jgi:hypothetical protein
MNDPKSQTVAANFPTFKRLFGWLFCWWTVRRCLFALVCLVTLTALFYAEENWRGARAWDKYRRELQARGVRLDYRVFIPEPVPDAENFAATPLVNSWFVKENAGNGKADADDFARASGMVSDVQNKDWGRRQFVDLVAWEKAFAAVRSGTTNLHESFVATNRTDIETRAKAAPAVLAGLKSSEANLAELRTASQRPRCRYPIVYKLEDPWGILVPHLARIKGVAQRLQLRACAELAAGRSDDAWQDVRLMLYLADSLKGEPMLISYLVRIACLQIAFQPIWEGWAEHRWSDPQLQDLQTRVAQLNLLADMTLPLDGERAAGILTADLLYSRKYRPSDLFYPSDPTAGDFVDWVSRIGPRGWYAQEKLNYCKLYENQLGGTFDPARKRVFREQIAFRDHELEREIAGGRLGRTFNAAVHHRLLAAMLLPALGNVSLKAAQTQTAVDQAVLACALERYRLANGQFPERLDALAPHFLDKLPNDVISGEPLKYRRTSDGRFILYSVGWNGKDDNGATAKPAVSRNGVRDVSQGDWVWQFPEM